MKKIMISTLVLVVAAMAANAQHVMDPSYSIHNYKHPNKADYMKKEAADKPVIYLEEVREDDTQREENNLTSSRNYKGMQPSEAKFKKFRVSNAPSARPYNVSSAPSGNYKNQFPARSKKKDVSRSERDGAVANNE